MFCRSCSNIAKAATAPAKSAPCRSCPTSRPALSREPSPPPPRNGRCRHGSPIPRRPLLERSVAHAAGNRDARSLGRRRSARRRSARLRHRRDSGPEGWTIPQPDVVVRMPKPVALPAHGDVDYTYEIVPTGFTEGKWVQMSEIRPSSRENVHHAVVYVRPPDSNWLRHAPVGMPFTGADMTDEQDRQDTHLTTSRYLAGLCAGKFAGQLARRHGEIRARRLRSCFPDALHGARPRRQRPIQHRTHFREASAEAARAHSAADQRSLRDPAGRGRLSRGSTRYAAQ